MENLNEKLEALEEQFNFENCGMSGKHDGFEWLNDDEANKNVYVRYNQEGELVELIEE